VRRLLAAALILTLAAGTLPAQAGAGNEGGDSGQPAPYEPEEFADWLVELRRFEVIAVGTFPAALLLSNLSYSLYRFVSATVENGGVTGESVPNVLGFGAGQDLDDDERRGIITVAVSLSTAVAALDWILGRVEARREAEPPTGGADTGRSGSP
jgi:hypothetical protein